MFLNKFVSPLEQLTFIPFFTLVDSSSRSILIRGKDAVLKSTELLYEKKFNLSYFKKFSVLSSEHLYLVWYTACEVYTSYMALFLSKERKSLCVWVLI